MYVYENNPPLDLWDLDKTESSQLYKIYHQANCM